MITPCVLGLFSETLQLVVYVFGLTSWGAVMTACVPIGSGVESVDWFKI